MNLDCCSLWKSGKWQTHGSVFSSRKLKLRLYDDIDVFTFLRGISEVIVHKFSNSNLTEQAKAMNSGSASNQNFTLSSRRSKFYGIQVFW